MGFLKKAGATAGITLALAVADSTCGGATCLEAYSRQDNASPNGAPIQAAVSLYVDNMDHMSPYAIAATFVPLVAIGVGTGLYIKKKSDESDKKKEK